MAADDAWGRPESRGFERKFIRMVRYENVDVFVHAGVVEIFREFFRALGDAYLTMPAGAIGWRPGEAELASLGLAVELPDRTFPERLQLDAHRLGLTLTESGAEFRGTPDDADRITRAIVEARQTAEDSIVNALAEIYRPGTRPLGLGSTGPDVHFLQLFMQTAHDDGVFDEELAGKVREFRQIRLLEEGEHVDEAFWLSMFPERTVVVSPGDGGMWVRMVQSLLVALDWSADAVTSQYGTRTTRAVRYLQEVNSLRVTGIVRGPEWGVLVHRPVAGFPLD